NALPNLSPVDRDGIGGLEAEFDFPGPDRQHGDREETVNAIGPPDHHRLATLPRQDQHRRTSVFKVARRSHSTPITTVPQAVGRAINGCSSPVLPDHVPGATGPAMRNTWTMVPVVNTWTTVPVAGSMAARASRTATPVILLISSRRGSSASSNSRRWNSWTWAAPSGVRANNFSASDRAPC